MQKRAGLIYLAKDTGRILLILDDSKWTVPTFIRNDVLLDDADFLFKEYAVGKIVPIELYLSNDNGFEYGTYICLVEKEFFTANTKTIAWCLLDNLPQGLHRGLKFTLTNQVIKTKILTIIELSNNSN
jgi:hypothetical protein